SEKAPTPDGQYFYDKTGEQKKETMINKMRGRGTYFSDELHKSKFAYTADLFNDLNDLNNLSFPPEEGYEMNKLTQEDKEYFIDEFINKGKNVTLNSIAKYKQIAYPEKIKGMRVNLKTIKPIFTEFKGFKLLNKM